MFCPTHGFLRLLLVEGFVIIAVVKADKIRGLKQLFTRFLLIGKKISKIINNYHIAHQKTT